MTDLLAALPPKPFPAEIRPAAGSGLENTPGLEDDHVDTGQFWSTEEGPTFAEFLDIINPLQHIPVVSTLYRAITGDDIGPGPRVAGGMLFGGPVGALVAGVTALFEEASGGDIGEHIAELIDEFTGGGDDSDGDAVNVAAAPANMPAGQHAAIQAGGQMGGQTEPRLGTYVQQAAVQQAAVPANTAMGRNAAQLNRIAVRPGAALGAIQRPVVNAGQNTAQKTDQKPAGNPALNAGRSPASATNVMFPARPMAIPFGSPSRINPNAFGSPAAGRGVQATGAAQPATPRTTIAAPQVSEAVTRSRRQQADLMLAQWAAQQMAEQNGATATAPQAGPAQKDSTSRPEQQAVAAAPSPAHPMLAPRNASPGWYAQAMDQALSRYRNGANTGTSAAPAVSLRR